MQEVSLRNYFRQIHLDFHTSEHCPEVGEDFDEEQFVGALKRGRVNSINVFAMGHHGWCYYPTKTGMEHPNLKTDLLGRMLKAGREAGINMPVYITVGWNDKASREHPEWTVRTPDGEIMGPRPGHPHSPRPGGWNRLCMNSPYLDEVVLPVTREVMEMYNPSGIWFDITGEYVCACDRCVAAMLENDLDPGRPRDRREQAQITYKGYLRRSTELVHGINPEASIYHNGHDSKGRRDLYEYWTHYEIESLPTGVWGYNHFPGNACYFTMLPDCTVVSMSGKFHRAWGEFGGFKNPDALRYEVAQMVSLGCRCCIGDQLHPGGRMDEETYRIIGEAYRDVEEREDWLVGAEPVADVAILAPSAVMKNVDLEESEIGAGQMLLESQVPFAVLDECMDFAPYRVIVLPDSVRVDDSLREKVEIFLDSGGALVLSCESGLTPAGDAFALDVGATYDRPSPFDVEYVLVGDSIAAGMVRSPFLAYQSGTAVVPGDAEVLAETWKPFFNRTYRHFCSHRNTPHEGPAGWPSVIRKDRIVYISQPIFRMYDDQGMQLHRDLFRNCLRLLYPDALIETDLPSCARVSLTRQSGKDGRLVLHLLYANPIKRGATEVIEDIVPLFDVPVSVRCDFVPERVYLAPSGEGIPFVCSDGRVSFVVPVVELSQIAVIE